MCKNFFQTGISWQVTEVNKITHHACYRCIKLFTSAIPLFRQPNKPSVRQTLDVLPNATNNSHPLILGNDPLCGLRGCKNWPAPFPGRMSYKATKPGLVSVLYLSMHYNMVLLFIRAPFYVLLVFIAMCSVFWLFWLSYQYLPSDWLERFVCVLILLCFLGQLSHLPYSFWR